MRRALSTTDETIRAFPIPDVLIGAQTA